MFNIRFGALRQLLLSAFSLDFFSFLPHFMPVSALLNVFLILAFRNMFSGIFCYRFFGDFQLLDILSHVLFQAVSGNSQSRSAGIIDINLLSPVLCPEILAHAVCRDVASLLVCAGYQYQELVLP